MVASMANQYLYEDKTNLQSLQGCGNKVYAQQSVAGAVANVQQKADSVENLQLSPIVSATGVQAYNFRRYTAPLKSGFLGRWWDDERLAPILAVGGVRVEITLEDPEIALQQIQTTGNNNAGNAADITSDSALGAGLACGVTGAPANTWVAQAVTIENCGFAVGNVINCDGDVGAGVAVLGAARTITAIAAAGANIDVTFDGAAIAASNTNGIRLAQCNRSAIVRPQWRVVSVVPPQEMVNTIGGGFQYAFTTWDYHTSALLASATQHQVELNSVATRAQCIMSSFTEPAAEKLDAVSSYFIGNQPSELNLNSVQYFLNNRLQPVRAYNPNVNNQRVIAQHELAKSFDSISHEAVDLGNSEGANLAQYTNTFMIARQLAKRPYHYDLKSAEGQIRLEFSAVRANNVSINSFVWNTKILNVGSGAELAVIL